MMQMMSEQIPYYQQNLLNTSNKINNDASETGIKIRSRRPQTPVCSEQFVMHGDASRRLRLQVNLNTLNSETDNTHIKKEVKDTARETVTKGLVNFIRSKSRTGFLSKKIAAMGCSYRGFIRVGVVAVLFVMSVCSLTAVFR